MFTQLVAAYLVILTFSPDEGPNYKVLEFPSMEYCQDALYMIRLRDDDILSLMFCTYDEPTLPHRARK